MVEKQIIAPPIETEEIESGEPFEEEKYYIPPHPEGTAPLSVESASSEEPVIAQDMLPELIQQAVADLRIELKTDIETQTRRIQDDLQIELKSELLKNEKVGLEPNAKN